MEKNIEIVKSALLNRRSVYTNMFTGEMIDDEIINEMLEVANFAPTHKFTQPWRFHIFKGNGIKKLSHHLSNTYKEIAEKKGNFDLEKWERISSKMDSCSHVISIGLKRNNVIPEYEEISAVAAAVQNMWILASAHKIGCYWSSLGGEMYDDVKSYFDLDENDKLMGFLFIGKYKLEKWPITRRDNIKDKIKWME
jgi:nitroreductase